MRPAMIVLGLAVLILAVFVTIGIVTSQSPQPVKTSSAPSAVSGTPLRASRGGRTALADHHLGRAAEQHPQRRVRPGGLGPALAPEQRGGVRAVRRPGDLPLRRLPGRPAHLLRRRHEGAGLAGLRQGSLPPTTRARSRCSASWPAPTATTGRWGRSSRPPRSARARRRRGGPASPSGCSSRATTRAERPGVADRRRSDAVGADSLAVLRSSSAACRRRRPRDPPLRRATTARPAERARPADRPRRRS